MRTIITFIDKKTATIDTYEESRLTNRKTVKALSALLWMQKQCKRWTWGYNENGHEIAETVNE